MGIRGIVTQNVRWGAQGRHGTGHRRAFPHSWLIGVVAAAFLFVACSIGPDEEAVSRDAAPDFQVKLFGNESHTKGDVVTLSQLEGQPVVLNFWYPSCPPCRLEMPDFESVSRKHRADGVQFLGVQVPGIDSFDDGQEFIDELGITYAIGASSDPKLVIDYGLRGFPTTVFLNEDLEIMQQWTGILNEQKLEELILELLQ